MQQATSPEILDRLKSKLSEYDLHILCDVTGSMGEPNRRNQPSGPTRWQYAQEVLRDACKFACEIDEDGIAMGFFGGSKIVIEEGVTADKVDALLNAQRTGGGTYLAPALNQMFAVAEKASKKDLIVVFLDGEVNDRDDTIAQLVAKANRQTSDNDGTVLFVQVGDDAGAKAFLEYLDDNLQSRHGAKFDIVDTKTIDQIGSKSFLEVLAEAIVD
jgi:hypothetical protein